MCTMTGLTCCDGCWWRTVLNRTCSTEIFFCQLYNSTSKVEMTLQVGLLHTSARQQWLGYLGVHEEVDVHHANCDPRVLVIAM